jgi:hypothetical protein
LYNANKRTTAVAGIAIFAALWAWNGWGAADRRLRAACLVVAAASAAREGPWRTRLVDERVLAAAESACSDREVSAYEDN